MTRSQRGNLGAVRNLAALLAGLILLTVTASPSRAQTTPPPLDTAALAQTFDAQVDPLLRDRKIPGAVVVVVDQGRVAFAKGYGFADIARKVPVDAGRTQFPIASVSKTFNYVLSMQLLQEGKIDLDADVNRYIRGFRIPPTFPQPITLRHLLSHTGGFERRAFLESYPTSDVMPPLALRLAQSIPARVRAPGTTPTYSNWGAGLVGLISENVLNLPYRQAVETRIFRPLGMARTSLDQDDRRDWATGYRNGPEGLTPKLPQVSYPPTGGVASTGLDMAKWMQALLDDGNAVLSRSGHRRLFAPTYCADPRLSCAAYGLYQIPRNGIRMFGHDGNKTGFTASMILVPDRKIGFFVAVNTNGRTVLDLGKTFLDRFLPAPGHPTALPLLPGAADRIAALAGAYRSTRQNHTTVERAVNMLADGDTDFTVRPAGPNAFLRVAGTRRMLMIEREPNFFVEAGGQDTAVFRPATRDSPGMLLFSSDTTTAYARLPWYETARATRILWAIMAGAALVGCLAALRFRTPAPAPSRSTRADHMAVAHAAAFLLFQGAWWGVMAMHDAQAKAAARYYPDYPDFIALPVLLGSVTVLAALALVVRYGIALVAPDRATRWAAAMAVYVALAALSSVSLWYWNLIGWPF